MDAPASPVASHFQRGDRDHPAGGRAHKKVRRRCSPFRCLVRPQAGQLKAVIGPNGAGKTTLFNLLTGVLQPDSGSLELYGRSFSISRPHRIASQGVARTFQTPRLFANMTNLENVLVGASHQASCQSDECDLPDACNPHRGRRCGAKCESACWSASASRIWRTRISKPSLSGSGGFWRLPDALRWSQRILLLDEPAAGLNDTEKVELRQLLLSLRDAGITLLLVEHDMRLVMSIADEIVVLDHGRKIAEGSPAQIRCDKAVLEAYLGAEVPHA